MNGELVLLSLLCGVAISSDLVRRSGHEKLIKFGTLFTTGTKRETWSRIYPTRPL